MSGSFLLQQVLEDPMLANFEMGLQRQFYPLGFPLELKTNSRKVMAAATEGWGDFSYSFDFAPLRLALGVRAGGSTEPWSAKSTFVAREHLLAIVMDADNFVTCDLAQGFSFGWITPALASDFAALRYRLLTPAAVMMAEHRALAPLHGALIARNNCGVALCGDSFAGKSTLAYAASRAGWTYITDDGTFVVRDRPDHYAVGNSHFIRFREDARQLFPELADRLVITRPNGKTGMELPTRDLNIAIAPGAKIQHMVFLNRDHCGAARLRPFPKDQMQNWCGQFVNFGSAEVRSAMTRCHRRLLEVPAWELCYQNLDDAVGRLDRLADSGG
jgi:hypothetical protein